MSNPKRNETKVIHRKLGKERAWGIAHTEKNKVEIDERLTGYKYMYIMLHEFEHILHPDWSETRIIKESTKIAKFLWQNNFRWSDMAKK